MSQQKKIILSELDFDTLKSTIASEFAANDTFNTYNFDGSALSTLLNVLAYNTNINSYYANMAVNESFLDTAIKRANVVSKAQALGYVPHSATASKAVIDVTVTPPNTFSGDIELVRGHVFTAVSGGYSYDFVNVNATRTSPINGTYQFTDVVLKQGKYLSYSFVATPANKMSGFAIPDMDVDMSTLRVRVQASIGNLTTRTYTRTDSILNLDGNSEVYFVKEGLDGKFNIYFGDGIAGKQLLNDNVIIIDYVSTQKDLPNGSAVFTSALPIGGYTNILVITKTVAYGGAERESIDSIKRYAPIKYTSQYRVVTPSDYEAFIRSNFQGIETIRVWGGEDNIPPIYGKVFASIKPVTGFAINNVMKNDIRTAVKKANSGFPIVFVDPIYLRVGISPTVKYQKGQTFRTKEQLQATIQVNTNAYFDNVLEKFGSNLIMSKLTNIIDSTDASIVGSSINTHIRYDYLPTINMNITPSINFGNSLKPESIDSTIFGVLSNGVLTYVKFIDDGKGTIKLISTDGRIINSSAGTINYTSGTLLINSFSVQEVSVNGGLISFYGSPTGQDIVASANYIITLDTAVTSAAANIRAGNPLPVMIEVN